MKKVIAVITFVLSIAVNSNAFTVDIPCKVVKLYKEPEGLVVVVADKDGNSFMFDNVDMKLKVGQKVFIHTEFMLRSGNIWVMIDDKTYLKK